MEETVFPKWLGKRLLEDDFPWDEAWELEPEVFIKKITLHDSVWIRLVLDSAWDNTATLVIKWDTYWNKDLASYPGDKVDTWPVLLIKVPEVKNINFVDYDDIGGVQRTISDLETRKETECFVSEIMDGYGGKIIITHEGTFKVLCFNIEGELESIKNNIA